MSYLLIGLGNPGEKYKDTRHNAGKMLARWLKAEGRRMKDEGRRTSEGFEIIETECFMNESGGWVRRKISNFLPDFAWTKSRRAGKFQISNLIIVHDDLDIPLGSFKIQFGKGPRLHKGILSVEQALGTKEFWRVRIGVDGREGRGKKEEGEKYVLRRFSVGERKILEAVFPVIRDRLKTCLRLPRDVPDGTSLAMTG